jgi:hypothetical protein|uniref:Uncharacterized protein n=1 Tax=Bacteriophage sp. TaxID=38018 RepID=A0A7G9A3Z3_9VIRU|nr:MAG: hypothetical protein [Bacteriophage sp.]
MLIIDASPQLFNPLIASPLLWLDGFDSATYSNGIWADKSGFGRNFSGGFVNFRPSFLSNGINSRGSLSFDGVNDRLQRIPEAWAYQYPLTIFVLFRASSYVPYSSLLDFYGDVSGITAGYTLLIKNNLRSAIYCTSTSGQPNYDGSGAVSYSLNETHLFVATITNNRIESWGNGAADGLFSFTQTLRTNLGTSPLIIGASTLFTRYNPVLKATVFIVPSDLSATRRQVLEGHFAWEAGIGSRLPTNHPFRTTRPLPSNWV